MRLPQEYSQIMQTIAVHLSDLRRAQCQGWPCEPMAHSTWPVRLVGLLAVQGDNPTILDDHCQVPTTL
jgi:hypothetical protein